MTWDSPMTYWLDLDELTAELATFRHFHAGDPTGTSVTLRRVDWHEMGRPGRITASPWRVEPGQ